MERSIGVPEKIYAVSHKLTRISVHRITQYRSACKRGARLRLMMKMAMTHASSR